jgi:hypothetical protein
MHIWEIFRAMDVKVAERESSHIGNAKSITSPWSATDSLSYQTSYTLEIIDRLTVQDALGICLRNSCCLHLWQQSGGQRTGGRVLDRLWSLSSFLANGCRGKRGRDVKLTIHLHLVSKSRMLELYLHSQPRVCLHCTAFNYINRVLTLPSCLWQYYNLIPWSTK